jgi:hypothetical protein
MPIRTVSTTGGLWNATTAWAEGVVPTSGDTIEFTAASGGIIVNVASTVAGINYSNYLNTITFSSLLTVGGTVSLGTGGYIQDGTSGMAFNATSRNPQPLTTNGVTWSRLLSFNGSTVTYTLNDQWNNTGTVSFGGAGTLTINGATLGIGGDLSVTTTNTIQGTSRFLLNGTGTWSHSAAGYIQNNIIVDTAGDIKMGNSYFRSNIFSYANGPFSPQTNTTLFTSGTTTFSNVGSIYWQSISLSGTTTITSTNSNFNIIGTFSNASQGPAFSLGTYSLLFRDSLGSVRGSINLTGTVTFTLPNAFDVFNATLGNSTLTTTINSHTMSIWGALIVNPSTGIVTGNSAIVLVGTNSSISSATTGILRNNLFINCESTLFNTLYYNTGAIRYIAGTVSHVSGSTLNLSATTTLNTGATSVSYPSGMEWNNVTMTGTSQTFTHLSTTRISGTLSLSGTTGLVNNGSDINVNFLSVTTTAANTGSSKINFIYPNGRWNHTNTGTLANPVDINAAMTFGSNIYYRTGTISCTSSIGSQINATGNTFSIGANTIIRTPELRYNNISINGTTTINMFSDLIVNGTMSLFSAASSTISFTRNGNNILFTNISNDVVGSIKFGTDGLGNTFTFTMPQDLSVYNFTVGSFTGTNTINGSNILIYKNLISGTAGSTSTNGGTTLLSMTGSEPATFVSNGSPGGSFRFNVDINKSNTVEFSGPSSRPTEIGIDGGTFRLLNGTVSVGESKTIVNSFGGLTWSIPSVVVGTVSVVGTGTRIFTLNNDLKVSTRLVNTFPTVTLSGTGNLLFQNTAGDITGSIWMGGVIFTHNKNLEVLDLLTNYQQSAQTQTFTGTFPNNNITVRRNLINDGDTNCVITGTSKIILAGTGSWTPNSSTPKHKLNTEINTDGTITIGTYSGNASDLTLVSNKTPWFGGATLSYIKGNVISTNAGINIFDSSTLDMGTVSINQYSIKTFNSSSPSIDLKSKLLANTIRVTTNCGFYGNFGFEINKFDLAFTSPGQRVLLQQNKTYVINSEFKSYSLYSYTEEVMFQSPNYVRSWSFPSLSSPTMSYLILSPNATHSLLFLSAQNIDSSGGKTIRTFGATLSNTTNWRSVSSDIPSTGWAIIS